MSKDKVADPMKYTPIVDVEREYLTSTANAFSHVMRAIQKMAQLVHDQRLRIQNNPLYQKTEECWKCIQEVYDIKPSDLEALKILATVYGITEGRESND